MDMVKAEAELKSMDDETLVAAWNLCQWNKRFKIKIGENSFSVVEPIAKRLLNERGIYPEDGKRMEKVICK